MKDLEILKTVNVIIETKDWAPYTWPPKDYYHMVSVYEEGSLDNALQKVIDIQNSTDVCMVLLYTHNSEHLSRMPTLFGVRDKDTKLPVDNDFLYYFGVELGYNVEPYEEFKCPIVEEYFSSIDRGRLMLWHLNGLGNQKKAYHQTIDIMNKQTII